MEVIIPADPLPYRRLKTCEGSAEQDGLMHLARTAEQERRKRVEEKK
jgi:hypothetical protein